MDVNARKLSVMQRLMLIDSEEVLDKFDRILDENAIVAYSTDGLPLTLKSYNEKVNDGLQDIANGRTLASQEVKEQMKSWSRK